jgi:hypothetical protein
MKEIPEYRPVNLPKQYETFPMPVKPATMSTVVEDED